MTTPRVVHLLGVLPIPVGHEVEVRVFLLDTALFGKKLEPQLQDPLIVDLDTGIVYGEAWHFGKVSGIVNDVQQNLPLEPRADLQVYERWRGRVTATRIAVVGGGAGQSDSFTQTSISIMPNEEQAPYR